VINAVIVGKVKARMQDALHAVTIRQEITRRTKNGTDKKRNIHINGGFMKGLIDIEAVNEKVKEIEEKKAAIREAAECGQKALDEQKVKPIKRLSIGKTAVKPLVFSDGSYTKAYHFEPKGIELTRRVSQYSKAYRSETIEFSREELIGVAACIIKAFGPIPQELIDSVQVE
jgi:hypothetical protein